MILQKTGWKTVIAGDRSPEELPALGEGLRSRFRGRFIAELRLPDLESRKEILRRRVKLEHLQVPDEVSAYIADQVQSDIRELDGFLTRLLIYMVDKQ